MPSLLGLSMAQEEEANNLEAKFDAAVKVIWSLPEEGDNLSLLPRCRFFPACVRITCLLVCIHGSRWPDLLEELP